MPFIIRWNGVSAWINLLEMKFLNGVGRVRTKKLLEEQWHLMESSLIQQLRAYAGVGSDHWRDSTQKVMML